VSTDYCNESPCTHHDLKPLREQPCGTPLCAMGRCPVHDGVVPMEAERLPLMEHGSYRHLLRHHRPQISGERR
jgi:hypothetical protein